MRKQFSFNLFVLGCQMNENDAERLRFLLESLGLKETDEVQADLIIVLLCSVRQAPVDRVWGKLKAWSKQKKLLILSGCVTQKDKERFTENFDLVFPILQPDLLVKFLLKKKLIDVEAYQKSKELLKKGFFGVKSKRKVRERVYIPLGTGCNNFCTYCVVPYTRGRERYRSLEEIEREFREALQEGAKKIVLIAQNVNSYKLDKEGREFLQKRYGKKPDFVLLLYYLNEFEGDFKIEFLTSHPKDMSDELIEAVARLEKVVKWIHLPVQSGDNEVLKRMNRGYTREQYIELVKKIRRKIPNVLLTTDIIVGFPGETEEQFQSTVDLVKECQFDQAFIAKFSPRPNTPAAKLKDDVSLEEKKRRFEILDRLINKREGARQNPWQVAEKGV